jgi:starvation-inducible DNA-binding protein
MAQFATVLKKDTAQKTAAELQAILVDLVDLSLQGKQAHWNVVGPHFRTLHLELDEVVEDVRKWADEIAERLRALGFAADGRAGYIAKHSTLESLREGIIDDKEVLRSFSDQLATAAARGRSAIDRLDGADVVTEDILIETVQGLEKHLWMFRSQQA